jgi:uncharacterized membrane protein HdeD (DUF308 family)
MIIAGVLAISLPLATSIGLVVILSWLLILGGIGHLISAFRFGSFGRIVWELIMGAVAIWVGFYMRVHPTMGLATLTLALAIYFLVSGCTEFVVYFQNRSLPNAGLILMHALVDILLFVVIWIHWPANSLWLIGFFVGIDLLIAGFSRLTSGVPSRRWHHAAPA